MIKLLLLLVIIQSVACQIIDQKVYTLKELVQIEGQQGTNRSKAILFILKAHPELGQYKVAAITDTINRSNQAYANNLVDFHFELDSPYNKIIAVVTLSITNGDQFVSISPLIKTRPQQSNSDQLGDFWISKVVPFNPHNSIINSPVSSDPATNNELPPQGRNSAPLGSFYTYTDLEDPLLQYALDYVASLHPNIINYTPKTYEYQLVAGVNIKLSYTGLDNYSKVIAMVHFNLKSDPSITAFNVDCQQTYKLCNMNDAWNTYHAIEAVMLIHPELFSYHIIQLVVEDMPQGDLKLRVTFENKAEHMRVLTEIAIDKRKSRILSFFTYFYAKQ